MFDSMKPETGAEGCAAARTDGTARPLEAPGRPGLTTAGRRQQIDRGGHRRTASLRSDPQRPTTVAGAFITIKPLPFVGSKTTVERSGRHCTSPWPQTRIGRATQPNHGMVWQPGPSGSGEAPDQRGDQRSPPQGAISEQQRLRVVGHHAHTEQLTPVPFSPQ